MSAIASFQVSAFLHRISNGRRKHGIADDNCGPTGSLPVVVTRDRALLREALDISPHLLFAKDREGRFTLANKAVADFYGTTVEGLIGKTMGDLGAPAEEVSAARRSDLAVLQMVDECLIHEERVTDACGRVRWLETTRRPLMSSSGGANQVLASATDITARKQTELDLARQRNDLEHLSRVTMLSELSGGIAHELNQPLTAILSNAQAASRFLAEKDPNLDEVREILLDIVSDDRRAGDVIKGLRLLLKKGLRRQEAAELNHVMRQALRLVNSDLLNAGIRLTTDMAESLPTITCDQVQVQQVLLNLLLNGCDAMSDNDIDERQLFVSTAHLPGEFVLVSVSDRGHGIKAEDLKHVFDAFFTTKAHGLGLGLAVCQQIITAHGGRIWATNNPEGGATFCFTLAVGPGSA